MLTTEFLTMVKVTASVPNNQNTFSTSEILSLAYDELKNKVIPLMVSTREEFFEATTDVALVANQASYALPTRSIAGKLGEISYIDASGNQQDLSRITKDQLAYFNFNGTGQPNAFSFKGSKVTVYPTPSDSTGYIRMSYHLRPNKFVAETEASQITAINTGTNVVSVGALTNSDFTTGAICDFVANIYGYETVGLDYSITNVSGTDVTFASLPSGLAVGDWLCVAKESPVIQLPDEMLGFLIALTAKRLLESQGDSGPLKVLEARTKEIERDLLNLLSPRIEGGTKKVVNFNSLLK
jgi:hypothetical protein